MKAIVRFSVDGEKDNKLGLKLRKVLTDGGFRNAFNTGTYETGRLSVQGLGFILETFWTEAALHKGPGNPGKVDHFWMYTYKRKPAPRSKRTGRKRTAKLPKESK